MLEFFKRLPYPAALALVAVVILGGGLALKPVQRKVEVISESERARLQELSQKKTFDDMAQLFVRLGQRVGNRIVRIEPDGPAGVIAGAVGEIVSAGFEPVAAGGTLKVRGEQTTWTAKAALLPTHGLVAKLQVPGGLEVAPLGLAADVNAPAEGSWLVLVGRGADGVRFVAPGIFSGFSEAECGGVSVRTMRTSIPQTREAAGSGIFDLDGDLAGLAIRCGDRIEAVAVSEVTRLLSLKEDPAQVLFRAKGLLVEPASEEVRAVLRAPEGLLVKAVRRDGVNLAEFSAGDVIVSVNGRPAATVESLSPWLAAAAAPLEMEVVSHGRKRVLKPGSSASSISFLRDPGVAIGSLPENCPAQRAGIKRGDRLVEVDGRVVTDVATAARLLTPTRPHFVVARRGDVDYGYYLTAGEGSKP